LQLPPAGAFFSGGSIGWLFEKFHDSPPPG
jgi:hypothetical protein